ncbi:hypothetical protein DSO57_1036297 [Entomophthora muscae]|uniref:Uncharacterized protein n=1 Tax=Entomophthora muscae TaxID=34485 RepID=A0ACC2RE24_9FUNG|nr:hypothetical protein DSO57_1036297 [Entomophthora muscae]
MVLTTGSVSPLVIPFATTFLSPLPPPIQEPTPPEITSPPIEEGIADPPIVPIVLNLGNDPCLVAYPLGTPDLEQVMAVVMNFGIKISHYDMLLANSIHICNIIDAINWAQPIFSLLILLHHHTLHAKLPWKGWFNFDPIFSTSRDTAVFVILFLDNTTATLGSWGHHPVGHGRKSS